jgi:hypothetical protein
MNTHKAAQIIALVYGVWPTEVRRRARYWPREPYPNPIWDLFESIDVQFQRTLPHYREVFMAQVVNYALYCRAMALAETRAIILPKKIPLKGLLPHLERYASEPSLHPEIKAIIRYAKAHPNQQA